MTAAGYLAASICFATLALAIAARIVHRRRARRAAELAAARRLIDLRDRIIDDRGQVGAGLRRPHGERFTLDHATPAHGKATHVSSACERSENRG